MCWRREKKVGEGEGLRKEKGEKGMFDPTF